MISEKRLRLKKRTIFLIRKLEANTSEARKVKSYLKRSPLALTDASDAWEFIYRGIDDVDLFTDKEYQAIYTALRFYAVHCVSNLGAYKAQSDGGKDIAELLAVYRNTKSGQNIDTKVSAILSASDVERLIRLLEPLFGRAVKSVNLSLDYAEFAAQINSLQYPDSARKVLLSWGKNYYKNTYEKTQPKEIN